jgi:hypothetical protein
LLGHLVEKKLAASFWSSIMPLPYSKSPSAIWSKSFVLAHHVVEIATFVPRNDATLLQCSTASQWRVFCVAPTTVVVAPQQLIKLIQHHRVSGRSIVNQPGHNIHKRYPLGWRDSLRLAMRNTGDATTRTLCPGYFSIRNRHRISPGLGMPISTSPALTRTFQKPLGQAGSRIPIGSQSQGRVFKVNTGARMALTGT